LGREPTDAEIGETAERAPERVAALRVFGKDLVSLDVPVGEHGEGRIGDLIADEDGPQVHELAERRAMSDELRRLVMTLPPREALVIRLRFGLSGHEVQTYAEIGERRGLTRERIRQLEKQALKRLREGGPLLAWAS
jgi:RNA polymerase sigma factor (sigma-70 family)